MKRISKHLDIIAKLRYLLLRLQLCIGKLYKSLVRSVLDYTDIIYDNCYNIDAPKGENIQRRACVILAGALSVTKPKGVLKEAGVEPRKTRRNYTDTKLLTSCYQINIHPLSRHDTHNYQFRNDYHILLLYYNSFSPSHYIGTGIVFPQDVLSARSVSS